MRARVPILSVAAFLRDIAETEVSGACKAMPGRLLHRIPLRLSRDDTNRAPDILDTAKRDEEHMRNVLLGLGSGGRSARAPRSTPQAHAPAGRHRFAQDGDVPVVRLSLARTETREAKRPMPAPEPVAADPVDRDRAARHAAERALQDVTATLHGVQTRLGHAELDLEQALSQVRARDQELQALRAELQVRSEELAAARHAFDAAPRRRAAPDARPAFGARSHGNEAGHGGGSAGGLSAAARQPGSGDGDAPEPVKWWRD